MCDKSEGEMAYEDMLVASAGMDCFCREVSHAIWLNGEALCRMETLHLHNSLRWLRRQKQHPDFDRDKHEVEYMEEKLEEELYRRGAYV